jgi:hypothetical protein
MTGVPPIAADLLHAREAIDDVVNHAVSKIFLLRVTAQI